MTRNITKDKKLSIFLALLLLWAGVFLLYLITLAPTILWGDNAYFQRSAFEGIFKRDGGGHWLWLQFARFLLACLWYLSYRVNLLSAAAATVTLIFLSCAMRALGLSWTSAIVACVCLAVSHTFWMHAVRTEVYTVFTAILALQLWLWLSCALENLGRFICHASFWSNSSWTSNDGLIYPNRSVLAVETTQLVQQKRLVYISWALRDRSTTLYWDSFLANKR